MKNTNDIIKVGLLIAFNFFISLSAQTYKFYQTDNIHNQLRLNVENGEVYQIQDDGQKFLVRKGDTCNSQNISKFELYKTKNLWNYILLDKCTGQLWQCQFSVEGLEYIFTIPINSDTLSTTLVNKFNIQPLTSMYQYYLINDETGEMWKFQWSTNGKDYIWIIKIN